MDSIRGSIVALVTPMREDGQLDHTALRKLIDWQIDEGTDCICMVGTTGESPTVSVDEHTEIIRVAVEHVAGRVPVLAGTGGNATSEAIELTRHAKLVGATASLQVVPYYNRPSQEGMYRHFRAVAEAVDLPLVLYNVPGRTVADLQHETAMRLAQVPGIVGIKDATGNIERAAWLIKEAPPGFSVYSGDDGTAVALMLLGGQGNVSVTANVAPRQMRELCAAAMAGDARRAAALQLHLLPLHRAMFCEPSPAPAKWAVAHLGRCNATVRLPLTELSAEGRAQVLAALQSIGLQSVSAHDGGRRVHRNLERRSTNTRARNSCASSACRCRAATPPSACWKPLRRRRSSAARSGWSRHRSMRVGAAKVVV